MTHYLLRNENAVYYECGFSCDNEIFFKSGDEAWFITDPRYTEEAKTSVRNAEVVEAQDLTKALRALLRKKRIRKLWYDPGEWSVADFKKISEKLTIHLAPKADFSKQKRIIKREDEIKLLKSAVTEGARAFERFADFLRQKGEGLSEARLFFEASLLLQDEGAYSLSFEPIVALNENASKPHALPTEKSLKRGDLILVDAGIKEKRYCSDRTRTAEFTAEINFSKAQRFSDPKRQKIYDLVRKAQETAIGAIRPGITAKEIDHAAREVIERGGYGQYFVHSTGHGVGLDIHELPVISKRSETVIEENMVFTIEPGIYLPGEFGVRIEDMVRVTADGAEVL
ncbi:MAG: X-Pro aminopeptidase [Campylobacteraceae bacterium 4484_4]|nr:MAG: X-Pro aminopeptidase [Campylobacteraceae bacterium 4484_4]